MGGSKAQLSARIVAALFTDPAHIEVLRAEMAGKEGVFVIHAHTM